MGNQTLNITKKEELNVDRISLNKDISDRVEKNFILVYSKKKRFSSVVASSIKNRKIKILENYDEIKNIKPMVEKGETITIELYTE